MSYNYKVQIRKRLYLTRDGQNWLHGEKSKEGRFRCVEWGSRDSIQSREH